MNRKVNCLNSHCHENKMSDPGQRCEHQGQTLTPAHKSLVFFVERMR